jgi:hypothetical protein
MDIRKTQEDKVFGSQSPYAEKTEIVHTIDEIDLKGEPLRWSGKLIATIGQNLLFEKRSGRRVLVDPTKVIRIIELGGR